MDAVGGYVCMQVILYLNDHALGPALRCAFFAYPIFSFICCRVVAIILMVTPLIDDAFDKRGSDPWIMSCAVLCTFHLWFPVRGMGIGRLQYDRNALSCCMHTCERVVSCRGFVVWMWVRRGARGFLFLTHTLLLSIFRSIRSVSVLLNAV